MQWMGAADVAVSATQLAKLAGVGPKDVAYWGRAGFLGHAQGVESEDRAAAGEGKAFTLSQLPKARLMGLFAKHLEMKASKASELADRLLERYADDSDAFFVTLSMVQLIERKIEALIDLILTVGLLPKLQKLLKEEP